MVDVATKETQTDEMLTIEFPPVSLPLFHDSERERSLIEIRKVELANTERQPAIMSVPKIPLKDDLNEVTVRLHQTAS